MKMWHFKEEREKCQKKREKEGTKKRKEKEEERKGERGERLGDGHNICQVEIYNRGVCV